MKTALNSSISMVGALEFSVMKSGRKERKTGSIWD